MKKEFVFTSYVGCDGHVIERQSVERLENPPITLGEYMKHRRQLRQ